MQVLPPTHVNENSLTPPPASVAEGLNPHWGALTSDSDYDIILQSEKKITFFFVF